MGVKGGLLLNAGTKLADSKIDTKMTLGGDIGIFGHFGLLDLGPGTLSLQPELFFSFGNGLKAEWKNGEGGFFQNAYKYSSFDIALLVGYDIPVGKISIRPFLGPKVGIPIGKMKYKLNSDGYSLDYDGGMKGATVGMDFGCGVAVPLGKFVLGGDIRYGIDFNKVKANEMRYINNDDDLFLILEGSAKDFMRRGALGINITAGYRF